MVKDVLGDDDNAEPILKRFGVVRYRSVIKIHLQNVSGIFIQLYYEQLRVYLGGDVHAAS